MFCRAAHDSSTLTMSSSSPRTCTPRARESRRQRGSAPVFDQAVQVFVRHGIVEAINHGVLEASPGDEGSRGKMCEQSQRPKKETEHQAVACGHLVPESVRPYPPANEKVKAYVMCPSCRHRAGACKGLAQSCEGDAGTRGEDVQTARCRQRRHQQRNINQAQLWSLC